MQVEKDGHTAGPRYTDEELDANVLVTFWGTCEMAPPVTAFSPDA